MLLLERYVNESIMVGDDILIRLVTIENGIAIVGIDAPKNIEIQRKEIYDRNKGLIKRRLLVGRPRKNRPDLLAVRNQGKKI